MRKAVWQKYCDLCGDQYKGKLYAKCSNYEILSCERCGLKWTNPLEYRSVATSNYWAEEVYLSNAERQKKRFREQLKLFLEKLN